MSVSHIPVAIWRKPGSSPYYRTEVNFDINLELVKHFINLQDGLPSPYSEEEKIKRSSRPSKIPILVHSSLRQYRHLNNGTSGSSSVGTFSSSSSSGSAGSSISSLSPPTSSPSSSASSSFSDLSPRIEIFPSYKSKSHKFMEHMNWMKPLPGSERGVSGSPNHVRRIQATFKTINDVSLYFLQEGVPIQREELLGRNDSCTSLYSSDLLQNELIREERYQALWTNKRNKNVNWVLRGKVVEWIISAASQFQYSVDTIYLAVFFIDAFLHERTIKTTCWPLLGLTAFHLAGKIEEKSCKKLSAIWKIYKNLVKISLAEVEWMEHEIIKTVQFQMMPTTPKLFADLAFASNCITFPCSESERLIKNLCYEILLSSLQIHEMSSIRSSYKAELAIQIATEYIMFYQGIFLKKENQTIGDLEIQRNAVKICFTLFRTIIFQPPKFEEDLNTEVHTPRGV